CFPPSSPPSVPSPQLAPANPLPILGLPRWPSPLPPRHPPFFLGDNPENDAYAAAQCGIGHRVLVAGGSTSHTELAAAVRDGTATHLIDEPGDLLTLMQQFSTAHS